MGKWQGYCRVFDESGLIILHETFILFLIGVVVNRDNVDGAMNLNLGCGHSLLDEYINVDIKLPCNVILDLRDKLPFADESIDEVFACCVITSLSLAEWQNIKSDWVRVLKPSGRLIILDHDVNEYMRIFLLKEITRRECTDVIWGSDQWGWCKQGVVAEDIISDLVQEGIAVTEFSNQDPRTLEIVFTK